jgi:hypothetical protein
LWLVTACGAVPMPGIFKQGNCSIKYKFPYEDYINYLGNDYYHDYYADPREIPDMSNYYHLQGDRIPEYLHGAQLTVGYKVGVAGMCGSPGEWWRLYLWSPCIRIT